MEDAREEIWSTNICCGTDKGPILLAGWYIHIYVDCYSRNDENATDIIVPPAPRVPSASSAVFYKIRLVSALLSP